MIVFRTAPAGPPPVPAIHPGKQMEQSVKHRAAHAANTYLVIVHTQALQWAQDT